MLLLDGIISNGSRRRLLNVNAFEKLRKEGRTDGQDHHHHNPAEVPATKGDDGMTKRPQ